jgi:hypothetical protein
VSVHVPSVSLLVFGVLRNLILPILFEVCLKGLHEPLTRGPQRALAGFVVSIVRHGVTT